VGNPRPTAGKNNDRTAYSKYRTSNHMFSGSIRIESISYNGSPREKVNSDTKSCNKNFSTEQRKKLVKLLFAQLVIGLFSPYMRADQGNHETRFENLITNNMRRKERSRGHFH
jgi:hypothetical protein